ncbi:hypothetical protein FUAX_08960 [Fulvitalea axinellae]|uniref:Macro domain-containing protein n=1 Tax=Fulvitalea axinellae TaxID=1182444 RepID=A0AAU9D211_9BACT|nr:hypothetical protein FUAX_08960 [Fulvitalea axinellae]
MGSSLRISLVHYKSPELGSSWGHFFQNDQDIRIIEGNILEVEADALVSPGNSFGFMDGGLDLLISQKYGWQVESELKRHIALSELGELLVGQALSVESGSKIVICAPTMRVPTSEGIPESVNAYLAMKAILIEGLKNKKIDSIAIPGLCTGTGRMSPYNSALQMKVAYDEIVNGIKPEFPMFMDAVKHHNHLKRTRRSNLS